jgi:hypothetical protein
LEPGLAVSVWRFGGTVENWRTMWRKGELSYLMEVYWRIFGNYGEKM